MSVTTAPNAVLDVATPLPDLDHLPTSLGLGGVDVALVRWPQEAATRDALVAVGQPRLLLVEPGSTPPASLEGAEDWLRWPPDPAELLHRAHHLSQRAAVEELHPLVLDDEDGMLRRGDRWVAVSDAQLPILQLLLSRFDRIVSFEEVVEVYVAVGGSSHPASVRTVLSRLESRIRPLGVEIHSIRRRGVVLRDLPRGG